MTDRLFDVEDVPEVPLFRVPAGRKGAGDARFRNDYPPEWKKCDKCSGTGWETAFIGDLAVADIADGEEVRVDLSPLGDIGKIKCRGCKGMGSLKARVRLEAGHRCVRCKHPYVPKGDARMLGVEPSGLHDCVTCGATGRVPDGVPNFPMPMVCPDCKGRKRVWTPWSSCDGLCGHGSPIRWRIKGQATWQEILREKATAAEFLEVENCEVEAEWVILTVHHLDGDKANVRWWNLAALCQRCHLEIQAKVVMERVYPFEHSEWFKPFVSGYYAFVYLCKVCGANLDWSVTRAMGGASETYPQPLPPHIPLARVEGLHDAEGGFPHKCEPGFEVTREEAAEQREWLLALERIA